MEKAPPKLCKKCGLCCQAQNCKYLESDNLSSLCSIYEKRPEKCRKYPQDIWNILPNCGYDGWAFKQREKIKQKIRLKKEELLSFETQLKSDNTKNIQAIKAKIKVLKTEIEKYSKYGSADW